MSIRSVDEQVAQAHSRSVRFTSHLKAGQAFLDRAQCPAGVGGKRFDGLTPLVERADISHFDPFFGVERVVVEPSKREPLRATNVGALGVDPTRTVAVQERARAHGMGGSDSEQLGVVGANALRFDLEHAQVVDAASAAPTPALKPRRVHHVQPPALRVDVVVYALGRVGAVIVDGYL